MARRRVTAAEKLRTLDLYKELQSTKAVGQRLGLSSSAVRNRLKSMKVKCRPSRQSNLTVADMNGGEAKLQAIRDHWAHQVRVENEYPPGVGLVPVEAMYVTLKLYLETENMGEVARRLKMTPPAVLYRLRQLGLESRPRGMRTAPLAKFTDMDVVKAKLAELEAEVQARQNAVA